MALNETRFQTFAALYREALAAARTAHPNDYRWPQEQLGTVTGKMLAALRSGSFNKDGAAFKSVCKTLGIAHTYKAIDAYLERR